MLLVPVAIAIICGAFSASAITPSDLPECAIECYIKGVSDEGIALDNYEGQCRSAPFQLSMSACAATNCEYDEFLFTSEAAQKYCLENFGVDLRQVVLSAEKRSATTSNPESESHSTKDKNPERHRIL